MENFIIGFIILIVVSLIIVYFPWFVGKVMVYIFNLDKGSATGITFHTSCWILGFGVISLILVIIGVSTIIGQNIKELW